MKPYATGRLIIALCGALLPALFAHFAAASQNPAGKRSSAVNLNGPNGLIFPNGLAVDDKGDLHISDIGAHCVLKLDRRGRLTVVAGTGEGGFGGDGGPATKARLLAPHDLAFDSAGDLLIADTELRLLAIPRGTLTITHVLDPITVRHVEVQGGDIPLTGMVRLPFAVGPDGRHRKARRGEPAFYLSDHGELVRVEPEERSLGLATARFELNFHGQFGGAGHTTAE